MSKLPEALYDAIEIFCIKGDEYLKNGEYSDALIMYYKAWNTLPRPKYFWEASKWILGSIGELYFIEKNYKAGKEKFTMALNCANAFGNPFLHMRLAECMYEMNLFKMAEEEFIKAYMLDYEGDVFKGEEEKYIRFLNEKIKEHDETKEKIVIKKIWWKYFLRGRTFKEFKRDKYLVIEENEYIETENTTSRTEKYNLSKEISKKQLEAIRSRGKVPDERLGICEELLDCEIENRLNNNLIKKDDKIYDETN